MTRRLEVPGLTPESLRHLYEVERLTETQIAERFGITQVQVGRFRSRWGIETLSKGDRIGARLPSELTPLQHQLVVGSLLGDGWMRASSATSAAFLEGHCLAQAEYTRWKAQIMEPFAYSLSEVVKKDKGREFRTLRMGTHSCPQLRSYYDLFYPEGKRVFPPNLSDLMTPFVLAVWYMDDGSVSKRGAPSIAFGLDVLSLERAMGALRKVGLEPTVYGEGGNRTIHFLKQDLVFRDLVAPHIPECMSYKVPFESEGQARYRRARELTPEQVRVDYEQGLSSGKVAALHGVGKTTVDRRLAQALVAKRRSGPVSK